MIYAFSKYTHAEAILTTHPPSAWLAARAPARPPARPAGRPAGQPAGLCTELAKMADHDPMQTSQHCVLANKGIHVNDGH